MSVAAVAYPLRSAAPIKRIQGAPEKPPLPTSRNLWFQLEVGIQTSKPMAESGTGEMVPVTRQKDGSSLSGGPGVWLSREERSPCSTRARVMVVLGSLRAA